MRRTGSAGVSRGPAAPEMARRATETTGRNHAAPAGSRGAASRSEVGPPPAALLQDVGGQLSRLYGIDVVEIQYEGVIGRGGFGAVYALSATVADAADPGGRGPGPAGSERRVRLVLKVQLNDVLWSFAREAAALQRAAERRHDGDGGGGDDDDDGAHSVVRLVDSGIFVSARHGTIRWLVTERCAGSLCDLIGRLALGERAAAASWLARDMLGAIAALHAGGIIHRDIKPDNVLLSWRSPDRAERSLLLAQGIVVGSASHRAAGGTDANGGGDGIDDGNNGSDRGDDNAKGIIVLCAVLCDLGGSRRVPAAAVKRRRPRLASVGVVDDALRPLFTTDVCTLAYIPPEMFGASLPPSGTPLPPPTGARGGNPVRPVRARRYTSAVDVWSVGVVLLDLVFGARSFWAGNRERTLEALADAFGFRAFPHRRARSSGSSDMTTATIAAAATVDGHNETAEGLRDKLDRRLRHIAVDERASRAALEGARRVLDFALRLLVPGDVRPTAAKALALCDCPRFGLPPAWPFRALARHAPLARPSGPGKDEGESDGIPDDALSETSGTNVRWRPAVRDARPSTEQAMATWIERDEASCAAALCAACWMLRNTATPAAAVGAVHATMALSRMALAYEGSGKKSPDDAFSADARWVAWCASCTVLVSSMVSGKESGPLGVPIPDLDRPAPPPAHVILPGHAAGGVGRANDDDGDDDYGGGSDEGSTDGGDDGRGSRPPPFYRARIERATLERAMARVYGAVRHHLAHLLDEALAAIALAGVHRAARAADTPDSDAVVLDALRSHAGRVRLRPQADACRSGVTLTDWMRSRGWRASHLPIADVP